MLSLEDRRASRRYWGPTLEQLLRPAIGFNRPQDVLKDPDLPVAEKRAILSTWASDACSVESRPMLRLMPGADMPVPLLEVMEALDRLEREEELAAV